jgi:hypothetical protein
MIYFSRSVNQTESKLVKLDIDISDFFVLDEFPLGGSENDTFALKFKFPKVLMTGRLETDILPICKNGGLNYYNYFSHKYLKGYWSYRIMLHSRESIEFT